MNNTNNWILTDDDSQQYVRDISLDNFPHCFNLIEMSLINPDEKTYEVYTDIILIDEYLDKNREELRDVLNSFGYGIKDKDNVIEDGLEDVFDQYKEDAYQVMAECIFEYYGSFQAEQIFIGSESECTEFIKNYIKNK